MSTKNEKISKKVIAEFEHVAKINQRIDKQIRSSRDYALDDWKWVGRKIEALRKAGFSFVPILECDDAIVLGLRASLLIALAESNLRAGKNSKTKTVKADLSTFLSVRKEMEEIIEIYKTGIFEPTEMDFLRLGNSQREIGYPVFSDGLTENLCKELFHLDNR